jgi:hypothetical protein
MQKIERKPNELSTYLDLMITNVGVDNLCVLVAKVAFVFNFLDGLWVHWDRRALRCQGKQRHRQGDLLDEQHYDESEKNETTGLSAGDKGPLKEVLRNETTEPKVIKKRR